MNQNATGGEGAENIFFAGTLCNFFLKWGGGTEFPSPLPLRRPCSHVKLLYSLIKFVVL